MVRAATVVCLLTGLARGDEFGEPVRAPGLRAVFQSATAVSPERIDPVLSFAWRGGRPDATLDTGPFSARWSGYLMSESDGDYQLHVFASGKVRVRLNGTAVLDVDHGAPAWSSSQPITLAFAWHPLEVEYERGGTEPRLGLYWSGPQFGLERIDERHLAHDGGSDVSSSAERGRRLARALRCDACHGESERPGVGMLAAPDLSMAGRYVKPGWIAESLSRRSRAAGDGNPSSSTDEARSRSKSKSNTNTNTNTETEAGEPSGSEPIESPLDREMPYYALSADDTAALVAFLSGTVSNASGRTGDAARQRPESREDRDEGRRLFLTTGCLACHSFERMRSPGLFGGGDLTHIAEKRPEAFFDEWLAHPETINGSHRMPVFDLKDAERRQLASFLATLTNRSAGDSLAPVPRGGDPPGRAGDGGGSDEGGVATAGLARRGRARFLELGCARCHAARGIAPGEVAARERARGLDAESRWDASCAGPPRDDRPGYDLESRDADALRAYYSSRRSEPGALADRGRLWIEEYRCASCHARGAAGGLSARLAEFAEAYPEFAPSVAAMAPPSLNQIGDKLHDDALRKAIRREGPARRPWLSVRMPRFAIPDASRADLTGFLVDHDRIPDGAPATPRGADPRFDAVVGERLVTHDGFGCTSCHTVGKVEAPNGPIHTMGPDLLGLGERIRKPWFDRWVRDPARIVPRIEMPSVRIPVQGVLNEHLDDQLAAVWRTLNRPDFRPPEPYPVRVVGRSGRAEDREPPIVLTDVLHTGTKSYIKPLLIALPSRDNILLDLEEGRLAEWWTGDAARQRTRGKSWFWESAGIDLLRGDPAGAELEVEWNGNRVAPRRDGQFITEFDELRIGPEGAVEVAFRLGWPVDAEHTVVARVRQSFRAGPEPGAVSRRIEIDGIPEGARVVFRSVLPHRAETAVGEGSVRFSNGDDPVTWTIEDSAGWTVSEDRSAVVADGQGGRCSLSLTYHRPATHEPLAGSTARADVPRQAETLHVAPGFDAVRLPLPTEWMPICAAWDERGEMLIGTLKGRVARVRDRDGDGLEESVESLGIELASPWGMATGPGYVDVINKYALLRLFDDNGDGRVDRIATIASGWGHTEDYHDWVIGLPSDESGAYYIGLPCQQDKRSPEAARHRGTVARLAPRTPTEGDPRLFAIETLSAGHRFPTGVARNRAGDLVVTDNQGNFNPFNELNHVRPGVHFGFINAIDRVPGYAPPPLTDPAINIPHPWTRSVNGIGFLEHPSPDVEARAFGPFAGHLIGCEYDTRRLIRMSLERVEGVLQGAAYPFTVDFPSTGSAMLGPIGCAVSPKGDLYVASIRDSGWGGANNIGELVRMRLNADALPAGVAEVRAIPRGFEISFTRPVDRAKAERVDNYVIASYRRVSTPNYGGPDVDRRSETPSRVTADAAGRRVRLEFPGLREGTVYEFHIRDLAVEPDALFFPAEAYYTLHRTPAP